MQSGKMKLMYLVIILAGFIVFVPAESFGQILNSQAKMIVPLASNGSAEIPLINEFGNEYNLAAAKASCLVSYNNEYFIYNFSIPAFKDFRLAGSKNRDDDNIWKVEDHVEIFIQTNSRSPYHQYIINTAGGIYDSRGGSKSWNGKAIVKVKKIDGIWKMEVKIPFSDFSFEPQEMSQLRGNVAVMMQSLPPTAVEADDNRGRFTHTWAATGQTFVNPAAFGKWVLSSEKTFVKNINIKNDSKEKLVVEYILKNQADRKSSVVVDLEKVEIPGLGQKSIRKTINITAKKLQIAHLKVGEIFNYRHYITNASAPSFYLVADNFDIFKIEILNINKLDKDISSVLVKLDDKRVFKCSVKNLAGRKFSLKNKKLGKHSIELIFLNNKGQFVSCSKKSFHKIAEPKDDFDLADLDASKYYKPVKYTNNKITVAQSEFVMGGKILPKAIIVNNNNILRTPVGLKFKGKSLVIPKISKVLKSNKNQVVLYGSGTDGDKKIEIKADFQYDGFVWYEVSLNSKKSFPYDRLELDIPLKLSKDVIVGQSRKVYDYQFRKGKQPLPGQYAKKFMSYTDILDPEKKQTYLNYSSALWLGTDEAKKYRGLCFINEGPKGWNLKNYDHMYNLVRSDDDSIDLKVNISDGKKATLTKKVSFSFGLKPFPFRKAPQKFDFRPDHTFKPDNFKQRYEKAKADGKKTLFFDRLAPLGANAEVAFEYWTEYHGYWKTDFRDGDMQAYVQAAHDMDIKVLFYFGFLVSNMIPEFTLYNDLILAKPTKYPYSKGFEHYLYYKIGNPQQSSYSYCHNSFWPGYYVKGIEQAIKRYNMDGVYLDGGFSASMCTNAKHGCGIVDPYGRIIPTCATRKSRRTHEKLFTIGQKYKKDFIINSSVNLPVIPNWGLVTSYYTGECSHLFDHDHARMSPKALRGWLNGELYGVPGDLLLRPPYNINLGWAQSLLVNADVRLAMGGGKQWQNTNKKVWQLRDKYNLQNKDFVPFFVKDKKIVSSNPDVLISYFDAKDAIVIVASNYWSEKANDCVIDLSKLIGQRNMSCDEIWYSRKAQIEKGKINTKIPALSLRLFVVKKR